MIVHNKYITNYFLFLFSIIPVTILIGSASSVINILLIDLSFIILIIFKRNFAFLKSKPIIYLSILYIYLIFNSFISLEFHQSFLRNFGFLRMIILFAAFNYFFFEDGFYKKLLKFWSITILIVLVDVFIESFTGLNIFGFGEMYGKRIVSFFKDEPIVGGYLNSFYLLVIGFLLNELKNKKNILIFLLAILFIIAIILTGERSNSIKAILSLSLFLFFYKQFNWQIKISVISTIAILVIVIFINSPSLKYRFIKQTISIVKENNMYFKLYSSGFEVFKNNIIFGVGNKNYREETCKPKSDLNSKQIKKYSCANHPHQIYFEFLSEHGLVGFFIFFFIMYKLVFSKIIRSIHENNYLSLGALINIMIVFLPILPGGAFFNNYMITIFIINLSIFYASDKNLNIFYNKL